MVDDQRLGHAILSRSPYAVFVAGKRLGSATGGIWGPGPERKSAFMVNVPRRGSRTCPP
jgi:hypothetical protein